MLRSQLNRILSIIIAFATVTIMDVSASKVKSVDIEPNLYSFYSEFKNIYETLCNNSISKIIPPGGAKLFMAPLKQNIIAQCEHYGNRFVIKFSPSFWGNYDDVDRRAVFWHESLHCFFQQDHVQDKKHFMFPYYHRIEQQELNRQLVDYIEAHCSYAQN